MFTVILVLTFDRYENPLKKILWVNLKLSPPDRILCNATFVQIFLNLPLRKFGTWIDPPPYPPQIQLHNKNKRTLMLIIIV